MAQGCDLPTGGQPVPKPSNSKTGPVSPAAAASRPEPRGQGTPQSYPSANNLPRMTKFSGHAVARRGNSRLRGLGTFRPAPSSRRAIGRDRSPRNNVPESPRGSISSQSPQPPVKETATIFKSMSAVSASCNDTKDPHDTKTTLANELYKASPTTMIENRNISGKARNPSFSKTFRPVTDLPKETSFQPLQNPGVQSHDVEIAVKPFQTTISKLEPPTDQDQKIRKESEETCMEVKEQLSSSFSNQTSSSRDYYQFESFDTIKELKPPISTARSPRSVSSGGSSDSGRAADVESNTEDDDIRPFALSRPRRRRFPVLEDSSEPESESGSESQASEVVAFDESDNESMPMSLDSDIATEAPQIGHGARVASECKPTQSQDPLPDHVEVTEHTLVTRRRMAVFDSDAFDAAIYRHANMPPPQGVDISKVSSKQELSPVRREPLFLRINPAIHRPYKRSAEWHREKLKEIRDRGGKKRWLGKIHQRKRFLQAQEDAKEEKRELALKAGEIPPRRDPQPQMHTRITFFANHPDEELPEDVRSNSAWMKAIGWFRKTEDEKHQRQKQAQKEELARRDARRLARKWCIQLTTKETERYFKTIFPDLEDA